MSNKLFDSYITVERVAYDMALALATKDESISTPEALIQKVTELLPACKEAAKQQHREEHKRNDIRPIEVKFPY